MDVKRIGTLELSTNSAVHMSNQFVSDKLFT